MYPMPTVSIIVAMLAGVIVAALMIGQLDRRLNPATRHRGALIFYALPTLPVMAFGLLVASARWPSDAGPANHCRDALCRITVFHEANLAMLLHQGVAELVCFGLIVVIFWVRTLRIGSRLGSVLPQMSLPLLPGFDSVGINDYNSKHFYIDPDTGQSYRIIRRRLDGTLVLDTKLYEQRRQDYINAADSSYGFFRVFLFFAVLGLVITGAWIMSPGPLVAIAVFIACICIMIPFRFLLLSVGNVILTPVLQARIGPPPVAPRGREAVQAQKAHGQGGWLSPQEVRDALRGDPASSNPSGADRANGSLGRAQQTYRD